MDYRKFDDLTLMRLLAHSEEGALGALYDRYNRLVYSIALNSLGDPMLAEEVTQDVFLRLWKHAASYQPEQSKLATWIVSITRNRVIDEIRRQRARPATIPDPWEDAELDYLDEETGVEDTIEDRERRRRVRSVIAGLPPDQRQALAYAYFKGYSHTQIAELLGEPLGTIKTRLRLAMKKLKSELIDEYLPGDKSKPEYDTYL